VLLAVDAGNTNVVIGLFPDGDTLDMHAHWRISTDTSRTADEYGVIIRSLLADVGVCPSDI